MIARGWMPSCGAGFVIQRVRLLSSLYLMGESSWSFGAYVTFKTTPYSWHNVLGFSHTFAPSSLSLAQCTRFFVYIRLTPYRPLSAELEGFIGYHNFLHKEKRHRLSVLKSLTSIYAIRPACKPSVRTRPTPPAPFPAPHSRPSHILHKK